MKSRMLDISVGDVFRSNFKQNDGNHWIAVVVGFNHLHNDLADSKILVRLKFFINHGGSNYYTDICRVTPPELESRWSKLKI